MCALLKRMPLRQPSMRSSIMAPGRGDGKGEKKARSRGVRSGGLLGADNAAPDVQAAGVPDIGSSLASRPGFWSVDSGQRQPLSIPGRFA
jgi:hypothetical protein